MPKVSIIIPNFNHHDFLVQRIESVLNQTFQDFELILLDDASTDDSIMVLQEYANHPKVSHLLLNDDNSGSVFKQWIKGIELAQGSYIWIAESDDYASPKFLESTISVLETDASLGMVFTDTHKVDSEGYSLGLVSKSKKILTELIEEGGIINKRNLTEYLLTQMVIVNASSVLFKKEIFNDLDFNTLSAFKNAGDIFVYMNVALRYNISFLPEPLNFMRLHEDNTTKKNKKSGRLHQESLFNLNYYLEDFHKININKEDVISYLKSNLFFFIDFEAIEKIQTALKRMVEFGFMSKRNQIKITILIFLYKKTTYHGRPYVIRKVYKNLLQII